MMNSISAAGKAKKAIRDTKSCKCCNSIIIQIELNRIVKSQNHMNAKRRIGNDSIKVARDRLFCASWTKKVVWNYAYAKWESENIMAVQKKPIITSFSINTITISLNALIKHLHGTLFIVTANQAGQWCTQNTHFVSAFFRNTFYLLRLFISMEIALILNEKTEKSTKQSNKKWMQTQTQTAYRVHWFHRN